MISQYFLRALDDTVAHWHDVYPYPVTIVTARYGGAYEGGSWLAFPMFADDVGAEEAEWGGDDLTCDSWWDSAARLPIGRGNSPSLALQDMKRRLKENDDDDAA